MKTMETIFKELINARAIGTTLLRSDFTKEFNEDRGIKSSFMLDMDTMKQHLITLGYLKKSGTRGIYIIMKHIPEDLKIRMEIEKLRDRSLNKHLVTQEGGDHYLKLKIQPLAIICRIKTSFIQGSIIKYISRYKNKNGVKDLKKALQFIRLATPMGETKAQTGEPVRLLSEYIAANGMSHTEGMIMQYALVCKWDKAEEMCKELIKVEYGEELE